MTCRRSWLLTLVLALTIAAPALAQSAPASGANRQTVPPPSLRRWFEIQNFTLSTRYRFIETSADVVTSNQQQYKDTFHARFNIDASKRYTINIGVFSGGSFTSSWNNLGPGTGSFDGKDQSVKQLFASAAPIPGLELQYGGLYVNRGESTEYTTYDDDAYIVGERVSVRRPRTLFLDEVSVTRAMVGYLATPNVMRRWDGLGHPNYTQVLGAKRFNQMVAGSLDYTDQAGAHVVRGAVSLRFKPSAPLSAVRYEQYHRTAPQPASGFAIKLERPITRYVRLQAGYATVDELYGNLNSDRILRGRRFFALATVPIAGPLTAQVFLTHALSGPYTVSNRTRFDLILAYDVLSSLLRTGVF